jgi:hypothetical protein
MAGCKHRCAGGWPLKIGEYFGHTYYHKASVFVVQVELVVQENDEDLRGHEV